MLNDQKLCVSPPVPPSLPERKLVGMALRDQRSALSRSVAPVSAINSLVRAETAEGVIRSGVFWRPPARESTATYPESLSTLMVNGSRTSAGSAAVSAAAGGGTVWAGSDVDAANTNAIQRSRGVFMGMG